VKRGTDKVLVMTFRGEVEDVSPSNYTYRRGHQVHLWLAPGCNNGEKTQNKPSIQRDGVRGNLIHRNSLESILCVRVVKKESIIQGGPMLMHTITQSVLKSLHSVELY
jgi:hypothetical protein